MIDPDRTDATLIGQLLHRVILHREAITLLIREPHPATNTAGTSGGSSDEPRGPVSELRQTDQPGDHHPASGEPNLPDGDHHLIRLTIPCMLTRAAAGHQRIDPTQPDPEAHGSNVAKSRNTSHPAPDRQAVLERQNRERLASAITRAHRWKAELRQGITLETIVGREGRSARNVRMMLNLAYLAPDLTEAALDHRLPAGLTASALAQGLPLDWPDQRRWILGATPNS